MLPRHHPDRIRIAFDDHRLVANAGLILPATLALRLGLPQLLRKHLDLGGAPGAGEHRRQDDDAGGLRAGRRRLHRRRRCAARRRDRPRSRFHGQGSLHPGHLPAQLQLGPRPSIGTGWAASCWPGPGRPGAGPGDGPLTIDLDSTICETYGLAKGGRPPPRLYRQAGLSPAAGHRRRNRRRADGPAARGPGQHRPGRRPLPCVKR